MNSNGRFWITRNDNGRIKLSYGIDKPIKLTSGEWYIDGDNSAEMYLSDDMFAYVSSDDEPLEIALNILSK